MFNVGGGEIIVIFLIALIVLGPDKLPGAARQAGKYMSEFRRMSSGFQQELRDAMDLTNLTSTSPTKAQSPGGPTTVVADVTEVPSPASTDDATASPATPDRDESTPAPATDTAGTGSNRADEPHVAPPATGAAAIPSTGPMIIDGPSGSFS